MNVDPVRDDGRGGVRVPLRIVAVYAASALLWSLLTVVLARALASRAISAFAVHAVSGAIFLALSSALLFLAIRGLPGLGRDEPARAGPGASRPTSGALRAIPGSRPVLLALAAVVAASLLGVWADYRAARDDARRHALADAAAVADLKVGLVVDWRRDRLADGETFTRSFRFATDFGDWVARGAPRDGGRARLADDLESILRAHGYRKAWLVGADGTVLAGSEGAGPFPEDAGESLGEARRSGGPVLSDFHGEEGPGGSELDVVAPLFRDGPGTPRSLSGFVVFEVDPSAYLFPFVQRWPGATGSGESLLVRPDGQGLAVLAGRSRRAAGGTVHLPARPWLEGPGSSGGAGADEGPDDRGVPVLAAWRTIPGTSWRVLAKVDAAEVYAPVQGRGALMLGVTLLLLALASLCAWLWGRQQRLWVRLRERTAQVEKKALAAHYGALWKQATDVIVLADDAMRIVDVNERAQDLYGWSRDELLGQSVKVLHPPGSSAEVERARRLVEGEGPARFETVHVRKDGSPFPVEVTSSLLEIDGKPFFQSTVRDIGDRKRAEEELRRSEERFKETFDRAAVGIAHAAPDGRLLRVNPKLCEILARPEPTLLRATLRDLVHPGDLEAEREDLARVLSGMAPSYSAERRFLRPDGAVTVCNVSVAPVRGAGGEVRWLVHVVEDLSERRRSETALRDAQSYAEGLVAAANVMIVGFDLSGRVTLFNDAAERVTGLSRGEVLGRDVFETLLRGDAASRATSSLARLRETGEIPRDVEFPVVTRGGGERWISWRHSVTRAAGVATGVVSFGLDVTESKQAEKRLEGMLRLAERAPALTEDEIVAEGLELAERLTGSRVSFCHLVEDDEKAVRLVAWSRGALAASPAPAQGPCPLEEAGPWADCVRTRRSVVVNDFAQAGGRSGLPEGSSEITRLVSSPVSDRGKVRLVLGVGNKDSDYTDLDVRQVELIGTDVLRLAQARRAEEDARQLDARFRHLVEGQKALFLEWTLEPMAFTWVGAQVKEMLGYEPSEWLADAGRWAEAIHPDERAAVLETCAAKSALGQDHEIDYRMVAADGRLVWVHDLVRIQRDAAGRPERALGLLVDVTEIHRKEALVAELAAQADRQLRTLETVLTATPDLVHLFDLRGKALYASASALDLLGHAPDAVQGLSFGEVVTGSAGGGEAHDAELREVVRTGRPFAGLVRLPTTRGLRDLSYQLTPVPGPDGAVEAVVSTARDVTEEQEAQRRIERLNRLYGAVSGLNRVIARSADTQELLQQACRVVVEAGSFVVAWIAWADEARRRASFIAFAGPASSLARDVEISLDPATPEGEGPTAVAIREGRLVVVEDFLGPGGPSRWKDVARRAGVASGAAVPIRRGGEVVAALGVFAADRDYFDPEMAILLEEIARDVSLALDVHEERERTRSAEAAARESEERLRQFAENTEDVVWMNAVDPPRKLYVSPAVERVWGIPSERLQDEPFLWMEAVFPEDRARVDEAYLATVEGRSPRYEAEFRIRRPDGEVRWILDSGTPIRDAAGRPVTLVGIARDVTARKVAEAKSARVTRFYEALSATNKAIVHAGSPPELFARIVEAAVSAGGFPVAWVAEPVFGSGEIRFVALAGASALLAHDLSLSLDPASPGSGLPTSRALSSGETAIENRLRDTLAAKAGLARLEEFVGRSGVGSAAAVPFRRGGRVVAALAVSSAEADYFDPEMVALLEEMGRDVSYALDGMEREEKRRAAEEKLRETARRLLEAERVGGTGSWYLDLESSQISYSEGAGLLYKVAPETPMPLEAESGRRIHPEDREALDAAMGKVRETGEPVEIEHRAFRSDGELRWVRMRAEAHRDAAGEVRGLFGTLTDVTERRLDEEQRLLWANVLEASRESVIITDADGRILKVNRAFEEITGYSASEAVGQNPRLLQSGRHDRDFYVTMWAGLLGTGRWRGEVWNRRKDGEIYPAFLSLSAVRDAAGTTRYIGISSDVSEQKTAAERVQFLSHHDPLTGLPNRSLFDALLEQALASARREKRRMAVLSVDVDLFKTFNESFGHAEGDRLLRDLAGRLSGCLRGGDALARPGGDEFLVLIPNVADAGDLGKIAQKLLDVASHSFEAASKKVTLTASLGIAVYPGDADDGQGLLRASEAAMYHAKESGRNNFQFFAREMNRRTVEALEMETRLLRALVGDELFLEFQPQVEIETGRIVGAEALVRWRDPERGVIGPGVFIPLAEERGLVAPIGEWVLRRACEESMRWRREGKGALPVAVNISALQFRQAGFEKRLARILGETGIDPNLLELELTESILMKDAEQVIGLLQRLREQGIRFAIDDFGTGWSSLAYLRRFPIDRLKIDQSFVRDLGKDPGADSIVQAIISLARNLRLRAVAEGVETKKQLAFLRFHGCDEAQGFLLCRPVAPEVLWARVADGRLVPAGDPPVDPAAK